ncbi:integumentary mucin C.1-like isoform X1 [Haliotis rubra]|uniref:integumentary mucin C.1-like isoform X1 n=1 Tax=Haliotis rubra TaxID=36100 RepID=UPI001EE5E96E|nr:integumentary mucin C.1-like isoform X1 [Haliotis rubra]
MKCMVSLLLTVMYVVCCQLQVTSGSDVFLVKAVSSQRVCDRLCVYTSQCEGYRWDAANRTCHLLSTQPSSTDSGFSKPEPHNGQCGQRPCAPTETCVPVEAATRYICLETTLPTSSSAAPSTSTTTSLPAGTTTTKTSPSITTTSVPSSTTTTKTTPSPTTLTTKTASPATTATPSTSTTSVPAVSSAISSTTFTSATTPTSTTTATTFSVSPSTATTTTTSATTTTTTPTTISTTPPTTSRTTPASCVSDCTGLGDGKYQSCERCNGYVVCTHGNTHHRPCGAGTLWNDNRKLCLFPPSPTCVLNTTSENAQETTTPAEETTTPTTTGPVYKGCYQDDENRVLPHEHMLNITSMTTDMCRFHCTQYEYSFFGLEAGTECHCGTMIKSGYRKVSDSDCNYPCAGDNTKMCGGHWKISIYQVV